MATSSENLNIETKHIQTAPGVQISDSQRTLIGSVLDLFAGQPSLAKLSLWKDDATFADPLTIATGRDRYAAQWYGLQQAFSTIDTLSHQVTDAGNPILLDLRQRYVIKGINKEQTIQSIVAIHTDSEGKITKVEDKWDGKLPEGTIAEVGRISNLVSPSWWMKTFGSWGFWLWSLSWETRIWRAFRHLNAVTVPKVVSVPKSEAEEAKKGN